MGFWSRLLGRETRSAENLIYTDPFVRALMRQDTISRTDAMDIPAVRRLCQIHLRDSRRAPCQAIHRLRRHRD